ncbi:2-amino-4-hydroxy-6-hydroxymethyldihydropteridine diphosphokinase [Methylomagnum ishizawai]|uniref:2-amino-4-hydroxy-6- hydroxymethyldihydropteridine diphosphokinase n=1 Tax=Methylomagnum ishizawai TaxID=1760988 RepID=UPI001C328421|nr:2-amino-4-hydroxy-6-hydroxymethyldihydropteridine diphosphokinase [Methylomagnum ishizawai]BBL76673.1 2-amino-4-hydroxy-6-hydroxymethyldihydropteridine diphosphokinase [Methylomagnum ishizawai]
MPEVFLGLGSARDRERHLPAALAELARLFGPLKVSSLYETAAVGFAGPAFHNLVVACETALPPAALLPLLKTIEDRQGRVRQTDPPVPPTLDIDLLLYGDVVMEEGKLKLPRGDILRHAFVLEPLAEIAPDHRHPVDGRRYAELWAAFDKAGLARTRLPTPWGRGE